MAGAHNWRAVRVDRGRFPLPTIAAARRTFLSRSRRATIYRVFLTDGTSARHLRGAARVGDRIVFSMPDRLARQPSLHLVNLAAERVDWPRTARYAESARVSDIRHERGN